MTHLGLESDLLTHLIATVLTAALVGWVIRAIGIVIIGILLYKELKCHRI